jgi:LysR family transcriptional regulator, cell division regulator
MNFNTFPHPTDLLYFQEAARTENLSRAAERLGVGQPALSLSLRRLEKQLESKLFLRRSRGLELTESGHRLLASCNSLMDSWSKLISEAKYSENSLQGVFRLGCHPSVGLYSLPPLFKNFFELYPHIQIQLEHGLSRHITESVISGRLDFGVVVNPTRHPDLVIRFIAKDVVTLWQTKAPDPSTLLLHPDLLQTQSILKSLKTEFSRHISSTSLEVLAVLAAEGRGVAILPERIVRIMAPNLKRVPNAPTFADAIALVYRADRPKTASAKAVLQHFLTVEF